MTYGPVDFIAVEFQNEQLKGEIMPVLLDLVKKKIVRVIDLVIIQKYEDGHHEAAEIKQIAPELLDVFDPADMEVSGIIQVEDIEMIAEKMEKGTTAAGLLFENVWAVRFKEAMINANGKLLAQVRLPPEAVEEALAIIANAESQPKLTS